MQKTAFSRLDDRVALIRNPYIQSVARFALQGAVCLHVVASTAAFAVHSLVARALALRCIVTGIPAYAKSVLFPPAVDRSPHPNQNLLFDWLRRNLRTLSPELEQGIHQAIEREAFSEAQENDLLTRILAQDGVIRPDAHDRDTLRSFLKSARREFSQRPRPSPLDELNLRQQNERKLIEELQTSLRSINEDSLRRSTENQAEIAYLGNRAQFIGAELPHLDRNGRLWEACSDLQNEAAALGAIEELENRLEASRHTEGKERAQILLEKEYCLLLRQRLALSSDCIKFRNHRADIAAINQTVAGILPELHRQLIARWEQAQASISTLRGSVDRLRALNPAGQEAYFQALPSILVDLHREEISYFQDPSRVDGYFAGTGGNAIKDFFEQTFTPILNAPGRRNLLSIKTPEERREVRHSALANELLLACLEKTPDGQQFFHLARKPRLSDTDRELREASLHALKTVHERNQILLTTAIYSTPEFVSELVGGQRVPSLGPLQQHQWGPNLSSLMRTLNLDMSHWHANLQPIWAKHLSEEQKNELRALSGAARQSRMAALFAAWFTEKTSLPFTRSLSFSHIDLPAPRVKQPALRTLVPHARRPARPDAVPPAPIFRGAPLHLVELPPPADVPPAFQVHAADFDLADMHRLDAADDPVSIVKRIPPYDSTDPVDRRINWLMAHHRHPVFLTGLEQGTLSIFAAFQDIAAALTTPAPDGLITAFSQFVFSQGALHRDNSWRKQALHCYLQLLFAGRPEPISVDDGQRKSLIQIAAHAEFRLPGLTTVGGRGDLAEKGIARFRMLLQSTPGIGLECLPESAIEQSFQESTTPNTPQTRAFIDALRARSGDALLKFLFPAVLEQHPITHDQGQQAIQRALVAALRNKSDAEIDDYFTPILASLPREDLNPHSLALPRRIFYLDCLRLLRPKHPQVAELHDFNQHLIESRDALRMLLGFSREIVRLSDLYEHAPDIELFVQLLQAKIAYQTIKKEHFSRREPEGFLKLAVDQAEAAISSCSIKIQTSAFDINEVVRLLNQRADDPALRTFAQKTVERIFRQQLAPAVRTRPFFLTFGSIDIDLITGIVYVNGRQRVELPPDLQNHPHLRSLNLQDLPYIPTGRSFIHFTEEADGRRIPQIRLSRTPAGDLLIQRRLATNFGPPPQADYLQYVPLEQFARLPAAIAQRMGITEFWQDRAGALYGYTAQGALVFSSPQDRQTILTPRGRYRFPNDNDVRIPARQAVLDHLRTCLPTEEIFIHVDGQSFWVPSLDLTISQEGSHWRCAGANISGVFLDTEQTPPASALVFKPERPPASPRALQDNLILARKHLGEAERIDRPSLAIKEERVRIQREIAELEAKLAQQDSRIYLTVLPERPTAIADRTRSGDLVRRLIALSQQIAAAPNPAESERLQREYLQTENAYHETLRNYQELCATRQTVCHETSGLGHVTSRNLAGTAFLITQAAQAGPIQDPASWIRELSKHSFSQPLDRHTNDSLRDALTVCPQNSLISLYLSLLLCQDDFLRLQEERKTITPNQMVKIRLAQEQYQLRQQMSGELAGLHAQLRDAPSALKSLLHIHCPGILRAEDPRMQPIAPMPPLIAGELLALSLRSPLESLGLMDEIRSEPRIADAAISDGQKALIKSFQAHSQDQVDGFYLEQFGVFTLGAFNRLFSLQPDGTALFGLNGDRINTIFEALKINWIETRPSDTRFTVRKGRTTPLVIAQEEMLALISELPLSDADRKQVARRLCSFLTQAARASFSFSWKDASSEAKFQRTLAAERGAHHTKMLDAEFFLKERLREANLSLTEFKKRVLIGDHRGLPPGATPEIQRQRFEAAHNALIRFLVLKTECQHLDNVAQAPPRRRAQSNRAAQHRKAIFHRSSRQRPSS